MCGPVYFLVILVDSSLGKGMLFGRSKKSNFGNSCKETQIFSNFGQECENLTSFA